MTLELLNLTQKRRELQNVSDVELANVLGGDYTNDAEGLFKGLAYGTILKPLGENIKNFPSNVVNLTKTGLKAAKYASENSLIRPSGLTLPPY
jgi:hypothetical protein